MNAKMAENAPADPSSTFGRSFRVPLFRIRLELTRGGVNSHTGVSGEAGAAQSRESESYCPECWLKDQKSGTRWRGAP